MTTFYVDSYYATNTYLYFPLAVARRKRLSD